MRALVCKTFGSLHNLSVENIPSPFLKPGEVLVAVKAAGMNFPDALMAQGLYQIRPSLPFSPGMELAGHIVHIAPDVQGFAIGDRVMATVNHGAYAEECVVNAKRIFKLPDSVGFHEGAAFIITYGTALHALKNRARISSNDVVLILGAGGGVGLASIQVARLLGAQVIAAASSEEKIQLCYGAGAHHAINYSKEDLKERIKEITKNKGLSVVLDTTGGPNSEIALRLLDWRGRYLVVGFAAGSIPQIRLNLALLKEREILGVFWGESIARDHAQYTQDINLLASWLSQGQLHPNISEEIFLSDVPEALERLQNRQVNGKIIVKVSK